MVAVSFSGSAALAVSSFSSLSSSRSSAASGLTETEMFSSFAAE
jgi:hypothetical protein